MTRSNLVTLQNIIMESEHHKFFEDIRQIRSPTFAETACVALCPQCPTTRCKVVAGVGSSSNSRYAFRCNKCEALWTAKVVGGPVDEKPEPKHTVTIEVASPFWLVVEYETLMHGKLEYLVGDVDGGADNQGGSVTKISPALDDLLPSDGFMPAPTTQS